MDDSPRHPSLPLKVLAKATRWLLWLLLAAGLVFTAAWAALHLLIVPRIAEFRPQLESQASRALGVSVRIGGITAHDDRLFPAFELNDVQLLDDAGRVALQLPQVLATLSPRSLWNLGFEQLYIDRPELSVRRAADGRFFVAGLAIAATPEADSSAGDWLFSQTEVLIRGGTLQWTDELRQAPPLVLQQVDLVLRNGPRSHALRLDATPPAELGGRLSLRGRFRQPLLSTHAGQWQRWQGQFYAVFERVNVDPLRRHLPLDIDMDVAGGSGALRAWIDVDQGRITGATADVALTQIGVQLGKNLPRLDLRTLTGRFSARVLDKGFELATQALQFDTLDGLHWPGGDVRVSHAGADEVGPARGELGVTGLDLGALAQLAQRLPLESRVHEALLRYAPQGRVEQLQARWQGALEAPERFEARGQLRRLAVSARPAQPGPETPDAAPGPGSPGVVALNLDFDLTQDGGRASVQMQQGHLELPGVFEEPRIALDQLAADLQWQQQDGQWRVQLSNARFANAHAQGELQLKWQSSARALGPGSLDLQGSLSRADLAQVHRYLPQVLDAQVRRYVREAVPQGRAAGVRFRVRGDLKDFPFAQPGQGEFRITASLQDARFDYVPRFLQSAQEAPWPALTGLQGELVIDRASLQLRNLTGGVAGASGLRISRGEARIPDLAEAQVQASLQAQGPLDDFLRGVIRNSPLDRMLGRVLGRASARGPAELQLQLQLPLQALDASRVQGQIRLSGNELQFTPQLPRLTRASGLVHFSESGFALSGVQARLLGGDVQAEGGTIAVPDALTGTRTGVPGPLRVQGTLTALGLRQASELGPLARLAQQASGSASYAAVFAMRAGVPEFELTSSLQGLTLNLPAPMVKQAAETLPLRIRTGLDSVAEGGAPLQDQLSFELGQLVALRYVRDLSAAQPRVLRGTAGIGLAPGESVPMPDEGVVASVNFERLDLDAWRALLSVPEAAATTGPPAAVASPLVSPALQAYLPTSMVVRTAELVVGGQTLNQFIAGGSREGSTWRANLDARELSGYMEYRQSSDARAGSLYARLARLALAQSQARRVETLLDEQPVSIPALDVVVDNMELGAKKLGRVEVEAINRGARRDGGAREWRLTKLNVIMPEAVLTASGNWAVLNDAAAEPKVSGARSERRRTVMNFQLDIADAGGLLERLQMPGLIRRGKGRMEGQASWLGSPLALDYPSLGGSFNINVETGQFLKAEPGIAKLLGVLSLQSLPRRLALDFRDVFSEGFSFDFVRGDVRIEQGVAMSNNLQMKGVNAAVLMEGHADLARETQELKVVVVPEINAGTASLIATWINPAVGLGSFLAQILLRGSLIESTTQEFRITGSWSDPQMVRVDAPPKPATPSGGTP